MRMMRRITTKLLLQSKLLLIIFIILFTNCVERVNSEEAFRDVSSANVNNFVQEHRLEGDGVAEAELVVGALQRNDGTVDVLGNDFRLERNGGGSGIEPIVADVDGAEFDELVAVVGERHEELLLFELIMNRSRILLLAFLEFIPLLFEMAFDLVEFAFQSGGDDGEVDAGDGVSDGVVVGLVVVDKRENRGAEEDEDGLVVVLLFLLDHLLGEIVAADAKAGHGAEQKLTRDWRTAQVILIHHGVRFRFRRRSNHEGSKTVGEDGAQIVGGVFIQGARERSRRVGIIFQSDATLITEVGIE